MPQDEWLNTRWGPPLPPWTKHQTNRARGWLFVILALTSILLMRSWVKASQSTPSLGPMPRPTPSVIELTSSDEYYALAQQKAFEQRLDAQLCSLRLHRQDDNGRLTYSARFVFCSPNVSHWNMQVRIWRAHDLLGPHLRVETSQPSYMPDLNALEYPPVDSIEAIQAMQEVGGAAIHDYLEEWPDYLELEYLPDGTLVWVGIFSYHTPGSLRVKMIVDAQTGQVIEVRDYEFRFH